MKGEKPLELVGPDQNLKPNPRTKSADFDSADRDEQIKDKQADRAHRFGLIKWVKWNVSGWLISVVVIISCCGFGWMNLSTGVLDVLLATTTVNILGLAFIVLKGLFK